MAIRPTLGQPQVTSQVVYTSKNGFAQAQSSLISTYQTASLPVANPPVLIGVDYVTKMINGTVTVTFPNLPIRGSANPISVTGNQPQTLTIQPGDLLIFEVSTNGPEIVTPLVIDVNNTPYMAPGLSTGTYKTFQATVTTTSSTNVTIWGKLYICQAYAGNSGNG